MAEFINTVDVIGDDALTDSIIDRSVLEYMDNTITTVGEQALYGCPNLTRVNFPNATLIGASAFFGCPTLKSADFGKADGFYQQTFQGCSSLTALILRNTSKLSTTPFGSIVNGTPIASGTGYIYVPRALVDSYKAATNWSTYAAQFRALEDYTVDGTVTGELDPTKIAA